MRSAQEKAEYQKTYRRQNRKHLLEYNKRWRTENQEHVLVARKIYLQAHSTELCKKVKIYYQAHKFERKAFSQRISDEWRTWCDDWKAAVGCIVCGIRNPICLDFHHVDKLTKKYDISAMAGRSEASRLEEVIKCVVICSNCHRVAHAMVQADD